ncbi:MAG: NADH-quinone oxidoreductase subunit NuoE, partial [Candidatus Eisenbacteria bacterium]|nr:NADH-quinone oxidoreductase subunit NuoE [Candidatus Eisenbacteria bacterium]
AQEELGFISKEALEYVADLVGVPYSKAYSVVSFYTMFRPRPVGRYVISVCANISCSLMGADSVLDHLRRRLGIDVGRTTPDGLFTLETVECLACCDGAPAIQVNRETHFNVTPDSLEQLLQRLRSEAQSPARKPV